MKKMFIHFSKDVELSEEILLKELNLYPVELDLELSILSEKFDRKKDINYQTYIRSYLFEDINLSKSEIIQTINKISIDDMNELLHYLKHKLESSFNYHQVSEIYVNDSNVAKLLSKFNLKYNFI